MHNQHITVLAKNYMVSLHGEFNSHEYCRWKMGLLPQQYLVPPVVWEKRLVGCFGG